LTNVKLRLVAQAQHMKWQNTDGVGDYDNAFSPVPAASGFRTILRLATQLDMFTDHVDISQSIMVVQSARIADFRGNSTLLPSAGGSQ